MSVVHLRDAELVDEAVRKGPVEPLAASARLRRVGRNVLDAETLKRAADLGPLRLVDRPFGLRRIERSVRAIREQRHRRP